MLCTAAGGWARTRWSLGGAQRWNCWRSFLALCHPSAGFHHAYSPGHWPCPCQAAEQSGAFLQAWLQNLPAWTHSEDWLFFCFSKASFKNLPLPAVSPLWLLNKATIYLCLLLQLPMFGQLPAQEPTVTYDGVSPAGVPTRGLGGAEIPLRIWWNLP